MEPDKPYSALPYLQRAVLLVFFMPQSPSTRSQRSLLTELANALQEHFRDQLRILRIEEADHPAILHCFSVTRIPTFILVRQGVELWRQEGMSDRATLVPLIEESWLKQV